MKKGRYLAPVLFILCLMGCAPVAFLAGSVAGVGGYKYYKGALTVVYQASYVETWDASLKALEAMEFKIEKKENNLTSGTIEALRADKKTVTVSLKYRSSTETEAKIRVGLLGDQNASDVVKDRIAKELFK